MTNKEKIVSLENLVLEQGRDQLIYLQAESTAMALNDEEYLEYLCCYFKKVYR